MKCKECNGNLIEDNGYYICVECGLVENEYRMYNDENVMLSNNTITYKQDLNQILEHKNSKVLFNTYLIRSTNKHHCTFFNTLKLYNAILYQELLKEMKRSKVSIKLAFMYLTKGMLPYQYYYELYDKEFKKLIKKYNKKYNTSFVNGTIVPTLKYLDGICNTNLFYNDRKLLFGMFSKHSKPMLNIHYILKLLQHENILLSSNKIISDFTKITRFTNKSEINKKLIQKRYNAVISLLKQKDYKVEIQYKIQPIEAFYEVIYRYGKIRSIV